jgi:hypothetical protein
MPKSNSKTYDIAVVGAGSAGVAAAVSAAQDGSKVCLIEKNEFAGGKATAAMVGTVCGLYLTHAGDDAPWAVGGFVREFAEELAKRSDSKPMRFYDRLHFLPYSIDAFKELSEKYLSDAGVDVMFNTTVNGANHSGPELESIDIHNRTGDYRVFAKQFIDCSGESQLSFLCSPRWVEGGINQAAARVFRLEGIGDIPSEAIHFVLSRVIQRGASEGTLPAWGKALTVVPGSYFNGSAAFKLGLPESVTNDLEQRADMLIKSKKMILECVDFLRANSPVFAEIRLRQIAPEVGFRTGYRSVGKERLLAVDVLKATKFDDGIANGAWPIEFWLPNQKVEIEHLKDGAYYQIQAGTLESKHLKNLYFAGRNLSSDVRAMASARVMGTCLATGFAAGILAAYAAKNQDRNEAIAYIRQALELNK